MTGDFRQAVLAAAQRPEVPEAVACLYLDLEQQIERRRPLCVASGRCCRFEEFGHRLYTTTLELAAFAYEFRQTSVSPQLSQVIELWDQTGCPFQVGKLCGVHAIRPFGCRIFFCDATADQWQREQYQAFHARLRTLHDTLGVPYHYLEWRSALAALPELLAPSKDRFDNYHGPC